jgi:hypothetical protein
VKLFLVALLATSVVFAAAPRAYVGLASAGVGFGYHSYTTRADGTRTSWIGAGIQVLEGTWFLTRRLGLGFRLFDFNVTPYIGSSGGFYAIVAGFMPTVSWVANQGRRGFGHLDLAVMPYWSARGPWGGRAFISAAALDYGYVPLPPWPLEGRIRATTMILNGSGREMAWQISAGIKVGLSWWFIRRPPAAQM